MKGCLFMKNMFKKSLAAVMAVASLAVGMVGMSASAYGGSGTFIVNGVSVIRGIDCTRTVVSAYTECNAQSCSRVYVSITGTYASTGSKSDSFSITRRKAPVNITADSGKIFSRGNSYHSATINGFSGSDTMVVYVG